MSTSVSREQFYQKYGNEQVTFDSYYKFTFTYEGRLPSGETIYVDFGGNADAIYRESVSNGHTARVSALQPYAGRIYKDGQLIEEFYDY